MPTDVAKPQHQLDNPGRLPAVHLNKARIHRATVTRAELHYEGTCAIDGDLPDRSGIRECEQIHIYNVDNGERFVTCAIRADEVPASSPSTAPPLIAPRPATSSSSARTRI